MKQRPVICAAARTPLGKFRGMLAKYSAPELGAAAVKAAIAQLGDTPKVDELLFGCVLPAGVGMAPARQVALKAGFSNDVPATTVNKVCGSGMKAVLLAADQIAAGAAQLLVAGGMESMSNAPLLLKRGTEGDEHQDHIYLDGLTDAYDGSSMGEQAQKVADRYNFTRQTLDDYATESLLRAQKSNTADEIAAIGETQDELPRLLKAEKIPSLKPAFAKNGTLTAASSSGLADGAAALLLSSPKYAQAQNLTVLAHIAGGVSCATKPADFTAAPAQAITKLLNQVGWQTHEVGLWEINEAFASVPLIVAREHNIPTSKINVRGGACAIGHPLGASGARIIVTLIHAMRERGVTKGIAAICIGGGEATSIAIEAEGRFP